jgi:hypothetical protein
MCCRAWGGVPDYGERGNARPHRAGSTVLPYRRARAGPLVQPLPRPLIALRGILNGRPSPATALPSLVPFQVHPDPGHPSHRLDQYLPGRNGRDGGCAPRLAALGIRLSDLGLGITDDVDALAPACEGSSPRRPAAAQASMPRLNAARMLSPASLPSLRICSSAPWACTPVFPCPPACPTRG